MAIEKILINGKIYTENPDMPWAEAMAIDGKKLAYVGDNDGAKALAETDTEVIDLAGKTVIPGLLDGHTHPSTVSKTYWCVRGPLTMDKEQLFKNIAECAKQYPKEERPYFYYESYFTETFGEEGPNRKDFDKIISDRPARFQDFGDHACCYNTVALEMLMDENGVPHSDSPIGEPEFKMDENGEYTGWCLESVYEGDNGIFEAIGWRPESIMNDNMSKPLFDYFRQYGIMAMMDGFTEGEENFKYIYDLDQKGELGMYYEGSSIMGEVKDLEDSIATAREWQKKYTTDHIKCDVIKFFIDGTNEMGDCLSTEPFHNDPTGTNCGEAYATKEEIRDVLVRLNKEKLDFHVHTICDGAFRLMCDAVEEAQKICGDDWCIKVCLAHCEIIHPDDIKRVRELGIYIDYSTHWAGGYFGEGAIPFLGQERWNTMHDFHKVIEDGGKVGFSSDVFSYQEASRANPMVGMQVAMTRVDPWVPLDPEKYPGSVRPPADGKLSIEQLIHGYTMVNAERMRWDDIMGSLEEGKMANFVVFEEDIFKAAHEHPEDFSAIDPVCTYFEGEERHIVSALKKER
ncbi:MAG: amidohydrolase family protein [Firmicutes bacterium]|nr:amidohydrolase family protein [Bacillota bacterium]